MRKKAPARRRLAPAKALDGERGSAASRRVSTSSDEADEAEAIAAVVSASWRCRASSAADARGASRRGDADDGGAKAG